MDLLVDNALVSGPYKRFKGQGYTFVIPKEWVADTAVELAKVQRRAGSLDYRMSRGGEGGVLPDAGELLEKSWSIVGVECTLLIV
jgi:hypothetical protein